MSPKQTTFYFTLWNRVCVELGWYHLSSAEKDEKRRALHVQAGCPASSKKFTNRDFDRFKSHALALLAGKNSGGTPRVDDDGERRRLVWRIRKDAQMANLDDAYIASVARDLHVLGNWQDLDLASLTNLRDTIHNRAGKKIGHDTRSPEALRRYGRVYRLDAVPRTYAPPAPAEPATAAAVDERQPF